MRLILSSSDLMLPSKSMCMVLFVRSIAAYDGISDMPVCVGVHWHKCVQASGAELWRLGAFIAGYRTSSSPLLLRTMRRRLLRSAARRLARKRAAARRIPVSG